MVKLTYINACSLGGIQKASTVIPTMQYSLNSDNYGDEIGKESDEGPDCYENVEPKDRSPQPRPLTVIEISVNIEESIRDCIFGADSLKHSTRQLPSDIPALVFVSVRQGQLLREISTCATLNEMSRLFNFNSTQHLAFVIVGRAILTYFSHEDQYDDLLDTTLASMQRLMLLFGMGGSGKSHIINGWIALCVSWSRPNALRTIAMTGVAAVNISGETFARMTYSFEKIGKVVDSCQKKYAAVRILVLDEVSMVKGVDLKVLDKFCRALTGRNLLFGGLIVVLGGDFCQLPPIGGIYVFQEPHRGRESQTAGYQLYRAVTENATIVLSKVSHTILNTVFFF